jgi:hypothetical protein
MRNLLRISTLSLILAVPAQAQAWGLPVKIDAGINARFNVYWSDQLQQPLAPWYLYWPMEAHFQAPAPVGGIQFPNWPSQWPPAPPAKADEKAAPPGGALEPELPFAPKLSAPPAPVNQPPAPPGVVPVNYPYSYTNPYYPSYPSATHYGPAPSYWYGQ